MHLKVTRKRYGSKKLVEFLKNSAFWGKVCEREGEEGRRMHENSKDRHYLICPTSFSSGYPNTWYWRHQALV